MSSGRNGIGQGATWFTWALVLMAIARWHPTRNENDARDAHGCNYTRTSLEGVEAGDGTQKRTQRRIQGRIQRRTQRRTQRSHGIHRITQSLDANQRKEERREREREREKD